MRSERSELVVKTQGKDQPQNIGVGTGKPIGYVARSHVGGSSTQNRDRGFCAHSLRVRDGNLPDTCLIFIQGYPVMTAIF